MVVSTCTQCRICHSTNLVDVVNLGSQYLASRFPQAHERDEVPLCPVVLSMCHECTLVQLKHTVDQPSMYEHQYGYRSGISKTMRTHLQSFNEEIQSKCAVPITHVLDIGSNDTTFLRYYPQEVQKVGCDPTGKQFAAFYDGITLVPTYFMASTIASVVPAEKFSVVSSISMFYDLPDPVQFAKDIHDILQDNGLWVFEQSYALHMIEQKSFDTICHEHLEYYNLRNIQDICTRAGMKIVDISFNSCNGGSMRVYAAKQSSSYASFATQLDELLSKETCLYSPDTYTQWMNDCEQEMETLRTFARNCKDNNQSIYVYGASTKGNTLLQYTHLDNTYLQYAVERNPTKVGKFTPGTNIEIISEETMRANPPPFLLVLPWHFKDEIVEREAHYVENGGTLLFPLPTFTLVSKKK